MKPIIFALLLFTFASCDRGLSKSKKATITTIITMHNITANTKFVFDSIDENTNLRIQHIRSKGTKELENLLHSSGDVYKNKWNRPYSIAKDYELTLDKYLEYCKANNKDPETFYKFMD